jgi:hypothetical protein
MNEQMLERRVVKLRKENKELRKSLNEMNINLKDMIVEKHSEIRSNSMAHPKVNSHNASYRSIKNKVGFFILQL